MQGTNPDAVVESLKRARRLHGFSLILTGIALLISFLKRDIIQLPGIRNLTLTPDEFYLIAIPSALGLLSLVRIFLADALKGARYLQDRKSAMMVGNFPWALSKYTGPGKLDKIQSLIIRLVMSFHPVIYFYYLYNQNQWNSPKPWILLSLSLLVFAFCIWIFSISQRFQKPILFDSRTEAERKDNLTKLVEAVEGQTKEITDQNKKIEDQTQKLSELIDLLKPDQKKQVNLKKHSSPKIHRWSQRNKMKNNNQALQWSKEAFTNV